VSLTLNLYPPSNATAFTVSPDELALERQANYPAALGATFTHRWDQFADETDTTNPVQAGAYGELIEDGVYLWRGKLREVTREVAAGARGGALRRVSVEGLDKLQVVNETLASYNGELVFSRETPPLELSNVELFAGYDWGEGFRDTWWPDISSTAWITTAASNSTTLGANMANSGTAITALKAAQTHGGFPPGGFFTVNSETCEYNGYELNQADGYWYFHNVQRARLGTSFAAHTAGATVYSRFCKRIHYRVRIRIEGNAGGTWEVIADAHYKANYEDGGFAFSQTPLTLRTSSTYSQIRASYGVYDEQGAGVLMLSAFLEDLLEVDPDDYGPGFAAGFVDSCRVNVDLDPDIRLTRVVVKQPTTVGELLRGLFNELGLQKGQDNNAIVYGYDPDADEIFVRSVAQAATADRSYRDEQQRGERVNIDQVKTVQVAGYEAGSDFNLLAPRRLWHTQGWPEGSANFPRVHHKMRGDWVRPTGLFPHSCNATMGALGPAPAVTFELLTDNDTSTGFGLFWDVAPSAGVHFYGWFPGASVIDPDLYYLDGLSITLEVTGDSIAGSEFGVTVYAYETFTGSVSTTPPAAGTAKWISQKMTQWWSKGGLNFATFTLSADRLFVPARAIGIHFDGFLQETSGVAGSLFGFKILEVVATGSLIKHAAVELAGAYSSGASGRLVAPLSDAKLRDVHMGQHRCGLLRLGPGTRERAQSLAWLAELQSLSLSQARQYRVESQRGLYAGVPLPGETLEFGDGFAGVFDFGGYRVDSAGRRSLAARVVNFDTAVTGS